MDYFLKSLALRSNLEIDEVTYNCIKILEWVYEMSRSANELTYKDVENIGKGIVYLNSCFTLFEEELPKRLIEEYPIYKKHVQMFFGHTAAHRFKSISDIFRILATNKNSSEHFIALEFIWNNIYETNDGAIDLEFSFGENAHLTSSASKAYLLVKKIFQLPKDQIDISIERTLKFVPFSIVGFVFCEPQSSFNFVSCTILAHKINEKLVDGSISPFFIRSLYQFCSISPNGKRFYWQCLKNVDFANGMISFFIRTLSHIFSNDDHICNADIDNDFFEKHRLKHILYLVWTSLTSASPCHSKLNDRIVEASVGKTFLIINKFNRIYDNNI